MNNQEVLAIVRVIADTYSNFNFNKKSIDEQAEVVRSWSFFLADYDYNTIAIALKTFVTSSGSEFPPNPSQLIAYAYKPKELAQMSGPEAWAMVRKAISRSGYIENAQAEFEKFPDVIKRAVGSASVLQSHALDTHFNESVESSNFFRAYNSALESQKELDLMPQEARARLGTIQTNLIGVSND